MSHIGEPRGERDVIRLRNPTEDKGAFRRMLTSADLFERALRWRENATIYKEQMQTKYSDVINFYSVIAGYCCWLDSPNIQSCNAIVLKYLNT